jgi:outer membrane lipoprotein-sorting protein
MRSRSILLAAILLAAALPASAQTVDELIAKSIQAQGGLDRLKAINSMKVTCKAMQGGMEIPVTVITKRPGNIRSEVVIQGKNIVTAYNGTVGWMINPFSGVNDPQKLSDDELGDMKDQADIDGPLVDYKEKGNSVELVGKEDMEGTPVYKLKLTTKKGDVRYIYLDSETGINLRQTEIRKQGEKEMEVDTYYSDYKPVNGVMMAHSMESKVKGQTVSQIVIDKVETNVDVDNSIFEMPGGTAAASKGTAAASTVKGSGKKGGKKGK